MINSREKGRKGEAEVIRLLAQRWPDCCRNIDQFKDDKRDVLHTPGVHWQIKRTENLRIYQALKQADDEASSGDLPVVAFRRNRSNWKAALDLEELIELLWFREST